ncbi:MAG: oligosaccharide flippase family protein [Pseudomonadota bacterium]
MKLGLGLLLTTMSKATRQISVFALSILLARFLSKDEYGTYLHLHLIMNIAMWAFMLGIPHSVYFFLPKARHKARFILMTLGIISTIAILVAGSTALFMDGISTVLNNPDLPQFAILIGLIIVFTIPTTVFEPLMISADRVNTFIRVDFIFNISYFWVIFIPIWMDFSLLELFNVLVVYHSLQAIVVLFFMFQTQSRMQDDPTGLTCTIKDQFGYALPIGVSQGVFELAKYGDKIIVSNFFNPATYAVYARGAMEIPVINIINNTVDNLLMPKFIQIFESHNTRGLLDFWHRSIRILACLMYPCFFFLVFTAHLLIPALYSDKYLDSVPIFQIYSCTILFRVSTYNVIVRVIGKTGIMARVALISEILSLAITFTLVHFFGLIGAPIATVIGTAIVVGGYLYNICFELNISWRDIFPWKSLLSIAVLSAAPLLPLYPLHWLEWSEWPTLGIMALVYCVGYLILVRTTHVISNEDKDQVREILPGRFKNWI